MSLFSQFGRAVKGIVSRPSKAVVALALSACALSSFAEDENSLIPSTGVDLSEYATEAISTLGGVVAVVVGGTIAFILIRAGIRWIRGMK